jgi:class 3 adenylate cyclase
VDIQLGDQMQKEMAILFSDIRSFTDLSEKLTPRENFNFLNSYLKRMSPIIQKNNGFIDKYIGDAIMALFPGEVEESIQAAIEMQREVRVYNQHRLKEGYDPIKIGCGIHTGNLMLGIIGADARMEGTVIADSVNVASRIEGLTKVYDASILISDVILKKLKDPSVYHYRYIDKVKVKGKTEYTVIYEIYDGQPNFMIELKTQTKEFFEEGITLYYEKNFKDAIPAFLRVMDINPNDVACAIYLKRAKYYLENGIVEFLE